ncbi:hypothetical protein KM043_009877 [Ampulex compressa]|nr:hypothetical protein KM043_009877 [Ampulex compressa]
MRVDTWRRAEAARGDGSETFSSCRRRRERGRAPGRGWKTGRRLRAGRKGRKGEGGERESARGRTGAAEGRGSQREGVWGLVSLPGIEESIRRWEPSATNASDALRHCSPTSEPLFSPPPPPPSNFQLITHLQSRVQPPCRVFRARTSPPTGSAALISRNAGIWPPELRNEDRETRQAGILARRPGLSRKIEKLAKPLHGNAPMRKEESGCDRTTAKGFHPLHSKYCLVFYLGYTCWI